MALDTTVAGANADSYNSLTELDDYFDNRRTNADAWDAALNQEELARQGTMLLDQLDFVGDRFTDTQALKWPRWYADTEKLITQDGRSYATDTIPKPIKYAHAEIVLWLADTGGTVAAGTVSELEIGTSVKAKFATGTETTVNRPNDAQGLPIEAARFLKGLRLYSVVA